MGEEVEKIVIYLSKVISPTNAVAFVVIDNVIASRIL
jgi:hypothetical protein